MSQTHIIEADNAELARAQAVQPDTYNNAFWEYSSLEDGTIACDYVEPE